MEQKLENQILDIVLKRLYNDISEFSSVLYIDFQEDLKKNNIEISDNKLKHTLYLGKSLKLIKIKLYFDNGLRVSIDKKGIKIMLEYGSYLSCLQSLSKAAKTSIRINILKNIWLLIGSIGSILAVVYQIKDSDKGKLLEKQNIEILAKDSLINKLKDELK